MQLPAGIQKRVDETVAKVRQGVFRLQVTRGGKPLAGARVKVRLKKHAFLFGCTLPHRDWSEGKLTHEQKRFLELWEPLFSLVVPENSTKGRMWDQDPTAALSIHKLACDRGLVFKSHAPVWGSEIKEHLVGISFADLDAQVRRRLALQFAAFKGNHAYCEVCNELVADPHLQLSFGEKAVEDWYRYAHTLDPDVKLSVNEYGQTDVRGPQTAAYVKKLKDAGVPVTVQGEQAHEPRNAWFAPERFMEMMDRMAANGVEVHLTEITQPDDGSLMVGGRLDGQTWTAENQAAYYREIFTLGFGHPACESVVMWAFWDGSSWLKRGGIVDMDFNPKPAYLALKDLLERQWHTEMDLVTDAEGKAEGRGFYGKYEVTVEAADGKAFTAARELKKGAMADWKLASR